MTGKQSHTFSCMGSKCEADLFLPADTTNPPVVVLGQGYGALSSFGTQGIIAALLREGISVFAFNYRGFGGSECIRNEPRQLIDPARQLEDWQAALSYVQELSIVDQQRMAIWGSSFAGGHVLTVAGSPWSKDFQLKAVVSQLPHCDSRTAFKHVGAKVALRGTWQGLKGVLLNLFGKNHTVAIVGREEDKGFAVMSHAGWADRYLELARADIDHVANWKNEIPARSLLKAGTYSPIDYAAQIECPVLVVYGLKDQGIPVEDVERTADLIAKVERFTFDGDHFEAYDQGAFVDEIIEREIRFLKARLFPKPPSA